MGSCLHTHHPSHRQMKTGTNLSQTTVNNDIEKKKLQNLPQIISAETCLSFYSERHTTYLYRKYTSICGSTSEFLTLSKMNQLFSYLSFGEETMRKLYEEFKKKETILKHQTFIKQCEIFINYSNKDLAKAIYRLYFSEMTSGVTLANKFQGQFINFLNGARMSTSKLKSLEEKPTELTQNLKQLPRILDRRIQLSEKNDEETCKWLLDNVNMNKFRLFFIQYGIQVDQQQAYNSFLADQTNLMVSEECSIINSKWCESMVQYIKQKYEITQLQNFNNTSYENENKLYSSEIRNPKVNIIKKNSLGIPNSEIFTFHNKKPRFVQTYDLKYHPGQIDNTSISGNFQWEIKKNIRPVQYVKVAPSTYEKLHVCFGGGPKFQRKMNNGYLDLKPFFIKIFKFQYYKEDDSSYLTHQQLQMVSAKDKVKNLLPSILNKYIAFHRNIGEKWEEVLFDESEETAQQAFTPTSFLVYMTMNFKKQFEKIYIKNQVDKNIPKIGDIYQCQQLEKESSQKQKICIRGVEKAQKQKILVKFNSVTENHPLRKMELKEFNKNYRYSTILATLFRRKNVRAGIYNLGNTCYLNASLQNIIAVREKTQLFREDKKIGNEVLAIIKQIQKRKKPIFPVQFKNAFDESFPYFKGDDQHDAHEFLLNLLGKIEQENEEVIKKQFNIKITSQLRCSECKKVKENIQSARIISLPLRDYNKKEVKVDLIIKNRHINTLRFEVDPQHPMKSLLHMIRANSNIQDIYLCEMSGSDITRKFSGGFLQQSMNQLKIQTQDYLVAYQLEQFVSNKQINLTKSFYTIIQSNAKNVVCKIERVIFENKKDHERVFQVKYKDGDRFYYHNVHETELQAYPSQYRKILIKVLNYDADYEQKIGIPFIFQIPAHYPLFCIRQWLQNIIGDTGYVLRIANIGNPKQCAMCQKFYCDKWECFTKDEQNFPIEWFENRMEFVVRWKSSFEYKERLKRQKTFSSVLIEEEKNQTQKDRLSVSFKLFEQASEVIMQCPLCFKSNALMQSQEKITTWPNILIFHLKRFRIKDGRICKLFTKWQLEKSISFGNNKYELKGVILHIGINIDSGHYVAIIDGFKYDNDVVKECEFEEAPSAQIYMLFYVKV